jgi:probable rRNA maturation factor
MRRKIDVAVRVIASGWRQALPSGAAVVRRTAHAALGAALGSPMLAAGARMEMAVVLADDATVRRLNRDFRGIDKPTNVLSFGGLDGRIPQISEEPVILGDVVLARETIARQAARQGKTVRDHVSHLVVHGILHLLGHDHRTSAEAGAMEAVETAVLAELGIADPYAAPSQRRRARRRG